MRVALGSLTWIIMNCPWIPMNTFYDHGLNGYYFSHGNHGKHGKFSNSLILDKNRKNPFFCLVASPEPCAKCYVLVFKSKLLRQFHNPHHITSFLQDLEGKTPLRGKTVAPYERLSVYRLLFTVYSYWRWLRFFLSQTRVFLFESLSIRKNRSWCWQEDDGSLLTIRFLATAGLGHGVLNFQKGFI